MRKGKASNTAQFVAYNRALGNLSPAVPVFSDNISEELLPKRWKRRVMKKREKLRLYPHKSPYPSWFRGMGIFNQFRTAELDEAIKRSLPFEQLVILGAGLDSRGWRLKELEGVVLFEADNHYTQEFKRQKTINLKPTVKEVKYAEIDFNTEDLGKKLDKAGYNKELKTFWLWEGVTMYLTSEQVLRNLSSIALLSSSDSMIGLTYMAKKNGKVPKSRILALLGEPAKSAYTQDEILNLGAEAGWTTLRDSGIEEWKAELKPNLSLNEKNVGIQWNERIWIGGKKLSKLNE